MNQLQMEYSFRASGLSLFLQIERETGKNITSWLENVCHPYVLLHICTLSSPLYKHDSCHSTDFETKSLTNLLDAMLTPFIILLCMILILASLLSLFPQMLCYCLPVAAAAVAAAAAAAAAAVAIVLLLLLLLLLWLLLLILVLLLLGLLRCCYVGNVGKLISRSCVI